MKVYTLFFTDESVPKFLGLDYSPQDGEKVVAAEAKPPQIGIIDKAIRRNRDLNVELIPGTPATVRVRSYPKPLPPQKPMSAVYHLSDGTRFQRRADGSLFQTLPDGSMVPFVLPKGDH